MPRFALRSVTLSAPLRFFASLPIIQKTQILLAMVLASLLVLLYGVLYQVVSISFANIEHDEAVHAVMLLEKEIDHQRTQIRQITMDYAIWDDTYFFLRGEQPDYIARNMVDSTFDANQLDLIIIADSHGTAQYLRVRGPDGDLPFARQTAIAAILMRSVASDRTFRQQGVVSSILDLPEWPVVISAHAVLKSDYRGPEDGMLIMGRRLDTKLIAEIEDRLSATVHVHPLDRNPTDLVTQANAELQAGAARVILPENDTWVHGFTLIRDMTARPVLVGEITQPRTIWAAGRQAITWTLTSFIAAGVIFACTLTFVLHRVVLQRLAQLIAGVQRIGTEDMPIHQLQLSGHDELNQLATTITATLSTVAEQRAYLNALHETTLDLLNHHQLDDLLQLIMERATTILDAPYGELLINEGDALVVRAYTKNQPFLKGDRVGRDEAQLTWQVCDTGQPVVIEDYATWEWRRDIYASQAIHAVAEFPIMAGDTCRGVLALSRTEVGRVFTPHEVWKGQLFSQMIALVVENASLYETAQREIAERAEVELALQQSARELQAQNAELDAFGHMVAHDLKGPLTMIMGYTQLLQQSHDTMDTNAIDHDLQTILKASTKMTTIINELLRLAMVGRSDPITDTTLDMAQIVDEATMRLAPMIGDAHALLSYPPTWPVAHGHAPWVEEVWVNYVSNALKYGGTPPHMVLGADAPSGGFVRFWIRDNGSGITEEQQDLLFNTFTRLQPTRATGHGLGLSIVSRIVGKLGGTVGVESTLGVGSTFFFTLPSPE